VLGHRVADGVEDHQQARRRGDVEQVSAALLEHVGDRVLGGPDLGHQVDVDDLPPLVGGRVQAAVDRDAGVGDEEIDPPEALHRDRDEALNVLLATDDGRDREGADRGGLALAGILVEVGQRDVRAVPGEARA
jgi:hypothetical protein